MFPIGRTRTCAPLMIAADCLGPPLDRNDHAKTNPVVPSYASPFPPRSRARAPMHHASPLPRPTRVEKDEKSMKAFHIIGARDVHSNQIQ